MKSTKIEWTETTWNPSTGCTKISAGCKNCYAERMSKRLHSMKMEKYRNCFELTLHPDVLNEPYSWKSPRTVFVNSMSDLFHEEVPFEYIEKVFKVMNENPRHTFQVLTKRSEIMLEYSKNLNWSKNIWLGVTIENQDNVQRLYDLQQTNAFVKFLSIEPLIGKVESVEFKNIDWVIVGGESGPNARPMEETWVQDIKLQCQSQNVPFFFKQWGGKNKKKTGRLLDGRTYDEMPLINEMMSSN